MKTSFQRIHPLRDVYTSEDWKRIESLRNSSDASITPDETDVLCDVFFDYIAAELQTHAGTLTLQ